MNRRKFVLSTAVGAGVLAIGGGAIYRLTGESDPLEDHLEATEKVLLQRLGQTTGGELMKQIRAEYAGLATEVPDIGGNENLFTEWLIFGVYYLALYRVFKKRGADVASTGELIFTIYQTMADYPKWVIRLVDKMIYDEDYFNRLKAAVAKTQERRYPGDWVAEWVEGDGQTFDYGLNIHECGICKFYRAQGA